MTQQIEWRRFPQELPYEGDVFLVTIKTFDGPLQVTVLRYVGHADMTAFQYFTESRVVAWAEVEPFNGEEKMTNTADKTQKDEDSSDVFNDYFDDVVEIRE